MTLDEAIAHAREAGMRMADSEDCKSCGQEHLQLADWLEELKQYRLKYGKLDMVKVAT